MVHKDLQASQGHRALVLPRETEVTLGCLASPVPLVKLETQGDLEGPVRTATLGSKEREERLESAAALGPLATVETTATGGARDPKDREGLRGVRGPQDS